MAPPQRGQQVSAGVAMCPLLYHRLGSALDEFATVAAGSAVVPIGPIRPGSEGAPARLTATPISDVFYTFGLRFLAGR